MLIYEVTSWLFMVYEAIAASGSSPYIWAYIATALLSGLAYLFLYRVWDNVPRRFPIIHFFIVSWSALMYLSFVEGQTLFSDYVWYMDWIISTPLIVLALVLTATYKSEGSHYDLIGAAMGLQFMLIVTGIVSQDTAMSADFVGIPVAFWLGCVWLAGLIYLLWGPFKEIAEQTSHHLAQKYKILAGYISLFFALYPTAWYLSETVYPEGPAVLGAFETSLAFVILPFFCKQVYGFLDMYMIHQAGEEM